jgi:hypothetical protein
MRFKKGKSGNPKGRPKGIQDKRQKILQDLIDGSAPIVKKLLELAEAGDTTAIKIWVERIVPRMNREAVGFDCPPKLTVATVQKLHDEIVKTAITGKMSAEEAERLIKLTRDQVGTERPNDTHVLPKDIDAVEASKIYQKIMGS